MEKRGGLAVNTALLTGSSLVMRCIALVFQVWLVGRIGSAGIGLFQLIMSVGMLASTLAVSGIRFASTRVISMEMGLGRHGGIGPAFRRCLAYSLFFGVLAAAILFFFAEPIGFLWVGDARTVLSLRLLALSLPFIAMSAVFAGYFTASGRVWKSAAIQVTEQLFRIGCVVAFLGLAPAGDLEKCCAAVTAGGTAAEALSFALFFAVFLLDRRRHRQSGPRSRHITGRMLGIALPLAFSAYARTSLSTLEHLLVPRQLKGAGFSADAALSGYGVIHGMVFPIITFPSCLLSALAENLVPHLTEAQVAGKTEYISREVSSLMRKCLLFSLAAAAFIFCTAEPLGCLIYKSQEAGRFIRIFSPLIPIIYMDIVTDGCLKGLGQMMWSMAYNIMDALMGVMLVITVLPRWALTGYIAVIYLTEVLNFALSIRRLRRVTRVRLF